MPQSLGMIQSGHACAAVSHSLQDTATAIRFTAYPAMPSAALTQQSRIHTDPAQFMISLIHLFLRASGPVHSCSAQLISFHIALNEKSCLLLIDRNDIDHFIHDIAVGFMADFQSLCVVRFPLGIQHHLIESFVGNTRHNLLAGCPLIEADDRMRCSQTEPHQFKRRLIKLIPVDAGLKCTEVHIDADRCPLFLQKGCQIRIGSGVRIAVDNCQRVLFRIAFLCQQFPCLVRIVGQRVAVSCLICFKTEVAVNSRESFRYISLQFLIECLAAQDFDNIIGVDCQGKRSSHIHVLCPFRTVFAGIEQNIIVYRCIPADTDDLTDYREKYHLDYDSLQYHEIELEKEENSYILKDLLE